MKAGQSMRITTSDSPTWECMRPLMQGKSQATLASMILTACNHDYLVWALVQNSATSCNSGSRQYSHARCQNAKDSQHGLSLLDGEVYHRDRLVAALNLDESQCHPMVKVQQAIEQLPLSNSGSRQYSHARCQNAKDSHDGLCLLDGEEYHRDRLVAALNLDESHCHPMVKAQKAI